MTFEFKAAVSKTGQISIPQDVAEQIPVGKELRVILTNDMPVDNQSYRALSAKLREASYASAEETVYDSFA